MTGFKPTPIEKAHNAFNIGKQLVAGQHRTLPNVRVLRVFKKVKQVKFKDAEGNEKIGYEEAFPSGDYKWYENPKWGNVVVEDGVTYGIYSILISTADAPTYERLRKRPRESRPYTYDFEMEEIRVDLMMMTYCEIARFAENPGGEAAVLRFLGSPVTVRDEMTKELRTVRVGYLDTVRPAQHTEEEDSDVAIAFSVVGAGMYKDTPWKDVPEDYVRAIASGRLGAQYQAQQMNAKTELERRASLKVPPVKDETNDLETEIEESEPIDLDTFEHQCEGKAATTGKRCRQLGTIDIEGHWFCRVHGGKRALVGGEVR